MKPSADNLRVLLLGSDSSYLRLIKKVLSKGAVYTESLESPEVAAQRLSTGDMHAMVLEVSASAHLDMLTHVRKLMPSVPVVVLTDDEELSFEALRKGAQDALVKGQVDEKHLLKALRYSIARTQAGREELKSAELQLIQAEKLESVGRLAAGVAHEVKNPLATIKMGVDYLAKTMAGDKNAHIIVREIDEAVRRANTVIRGLLDFSVTRELNLKTMHLNSIVELSLILVRHDLDSKRINVVKDLDEGLPPLQLDINKIEQVFINVIANAIYAMPEKGTLWIKSYVKKEATGCFAVAEIEDNGPGIQEDKLPMLFDPFFTTKPTGEGSGLGLTVCQKIMSLHGGLITISNRSQGGARVSLRFDADAAAHAGIVGVDNA